MLAPWKESCDQPGQRIKKWNHCFANKGPSSQSYGFSSGHVWMWELAVEKVKHRRIGAFELRCCRRLLRTLWTARIWNQLILKEISPEYSLEGLMLKLKLQYFGHLMWRANSWKGPWCWERLKAEREAGDRGWDGWDSVIDSVDMSLSRLWEIVKDMEAWSAAVHVVVKSRAWLRGWTTTTNLVIMSNIRMGHMVNPKVLAWICLQSNWNLNPSSTCISSMTLGKLISLSLFSHL